MRAIELQMLDHPVLAELSEAPERYAATQGVVLTPHADLVQAVARQTRNFVQHGGITAPWGGYLAVDPLTRIVVGTCAFKGPPNRRGEVEVAYFTGTPQCESSKNSGSDGIATCRMWKMGLYGGGCGRCPPGDPPSRRQPDPRTQPTGRIGARVRTARRFSRCWAT